MAELDSKRSIFFRSWFCCFSSRPKHNEVFFVKPLSDSKEEEYDYVVEKLSVKKVPVSLFEDYQHENIGTNVHRFPSRSSSDYEDTSEKCLAVYNLNNYNDSRYSEIRNETKVAIKKEISSSHSTIKKVSAEYFKKCNFISLVKSKLKNTKRGTLEISTFSDNFEETDYQENLPESSQDISIRNSNNRTIKTCKNERKHLKMDTFGCNYYIKHDNKTALVEQINNLQSNCMIQEVSHLEEKYDQSTQTCEKYIAMLQNQIKVTASTNTETSHDAVNKSALTSGVLEPIKINLTLSTIKNKERNNQLKQLDKECQTENKPSILRLNDIIDEGPINKKCSYKNRINDQSTKYSNNIPINVHYSKNDIPEKESRYGLVGTFQRNCKTFYPPLKSDGEIIGNTYPELNSVNVVVPSTNFFNENQNSNMMNNSNRYYSQKHKQKSSTTLNVNKKSVEDDQDFNYYPERDTKKSTSSSESFERNMEFNFQMGQAQRQIILHSIKDTQNAQEEDSMKETDGEGDKIHSGAKLPESDSQFTQSITLTESNSESSKQIIQPSRNIQEIRNVNISNNSPFSSAMHNKNLKNAFLRSELPGSPRLNEIQRIAELASSENNPIKWKIVIKQRKVPEELQKLK